MKEQRELTKPIHVIGGGLAGSEAAWQAAEAGVPVILHEMRPKRKTDAHKTDHLAELATTAAQWDSAIRGLPHKVDRYRFTAADVARITGGTSHLHF